MLPSCMPSIAYSPLVSAAVLPVTMQSTVMFNYEHMEKHPRRSRGWIHPLITMYFAHLILGGGACSGVRASGQLSLFRMFFAIFVVVYFAVPKTMGAVPLLVCLHSCQI